MFQQVSDFVGWPSPVPVRTPKSANRALSGPADTVTSHWRTPGAVGARIGDGGFGAVFEAENTAGEKAAVRLVPKAPGTEREMLFTDLDGVRNVVPVIDSGEHEGQWVLVVPCAEKSLRDHLQEHGQLPLSEVVAVLSDVAEALADLKDREVVHRDLKPENILLLGGRRCPGV
ncbi:protein kinase [Streptomyces sp. NPDC002659]|uniref:protein kinase domain-containing protein n=1 Tax=Streptomyces sp. NPDC002659 TaxID=3364656 RepID=UPI003687BCA6